MSEQQLGQDGLVAALSAAARQLEHAGGEKETLSRIVSGAVAMVPGAEQAGVSILHKDGSVSSHEPSSEVIAGVDQLQSTYWEGPCVTALWDEHTVVVEDLAAEAARWPRFAPEASARGVGSMLSFQLFAAKDTLGAINLYSSVAGGFTADSRTLGELFASHAASALGAARQADQLHQAMSTRDVIGQAKGILMERFGIDAEAAFAMLVSSSQETNVKLVDVARWLARSAGGSTSEE